MLSNIQKNIIVQGLQIRKNRGEDPSVIISGYRNLTEKEKVEILKLIR